MVAIVDFLQFGCEAATLWSGHEEAGMKHTSPGRIEGTGGFSFEDDGFVGTVGTGHANELETGIIGLKTPPKTWLF